MSGLSMDQRERAKYVAFVGSAPIVLLFDSLFVIGLFRGTFPAASGSTIVTGGALLVFSTWLYPLRPKVARLLARRLVLILLGILVAAAAANVLVLVFLRNLLLAGAIFPIGGLTVEFIAANRLLKRAGLLPVRAKAQ